MSFETPLPMQVRGLPAVVVACLSAALVCGASAQAPSSAEQESAVAPAPPAETDRPLQAGTEVPAPKRKHLVLPEYPETAKALGVRGIVLVELVIERDGSIGDARVVRSIPELDEAALVAVRQWEYEISHVDGRPVRVRLAVPITFSLRLPDLQREEGVPELRQGVLPPFPVDAGSGSTVEADVTLDASGHVAEALILKGEGPWAESLLRALRTWVFAWDDPHALVAFRVQAQYVRGKKGGEPQITLRALGARRLEALAPAGGPTPAPEAAAQAAGEEPPQPPVAPQAAVAPAAPPTAEPAAATAPAPAPTAGAAPPETRPAASAAAEPVGAPPTEGAKSRPTHPPVEVIHVPPPRSAPPAPGATPPASGGAAESAPQPPQPGFSSVRDVVLAVGVPDLAQGRRPAVPPLARMAGTAGTVEVAFSVGASGLTMVQTTTGPDVFKLAAQETVQSWVFRRTSTERVYLLAQIEYGADTAKAKVSLVP